MKRKPITVLLILLMCLTTLGALGEGVTVTDMKGREIVLSAPAERILALSAADCEILCTLGAGDQLVGRGEYCNYPEQVLSLPVVNSGAGTNIEQIIALKPDVVLMTTMAQTVEQVEALERAGITVVVSEAHDIKGVYDSISLIGAVAGKPDEAAALIARMQAAFKDIAAHAQGGGKTVYFEVSPLQWGLWTAGSGTFMDEIAHICGLENAFADVVGWAPISEEQILARNPDYIVTVSPVIEGMPSPEDEIKGRVGWNSVKAVQNDGILCADNDAFTLPGPRLIDAAAALTAFVQKEVK